MTRFVYLVIVSFLSIEELREAILQHAELVQGQSARDRGRARIVDAARARFAAQGYRKTGVDQIAKDAGVAKGSFYLHFASKAELLFHAVAYEKQRLAEVFLPIFDPAIDPKERLLRYLAAVFQTTSTLPLTARLMRGDREFLAALDEIGGDVREGILEMQLIIMQSVLREVPWPGGWTDDALRERGAVLLSCLYASPALMDPAVRSGLSEERMAHLLAHVIGTGLMTPEPSGEP